MSVGWHDGTKTHAGVLVPWANTVVEAELHRVTGQSVIWHYARLVPASRTTGLDAQFLEGLLDAVPATLAQLSALPLRCTYLACTSAAFMYPEIADAIQHKASVALVTAFDAITTALSGLAADHVVLVTPYPDEVAEAEGRMFRRSGITVTGCVSLGIDDCYDTVTEEQVRELIGNVGCAAMDKAEAIVLSCTGWPTLDLIPELQKNTGKPVISSNLAIGRHAQQAKET